MRPTVHESYIFALTGRHVRRNRQEPRDAASVDHARDHVQPMLREEELRKSQRNSLWPRRHRQVRVTSLHVHAAYCSGDNSLWILQYPDLLFAMQINVAVSLFCHDVGCQLCSDIFRFLSFCWKSWKCCFALSLALRQKENTDWCCNAETSRQCVAVLIFNAQALRPVRRRVTLSAQTRHDVTLTAHDALTSFNRLTSKKWKKIKPELLLADCPLMKNHEFILP